MENINSIIRKNINLIFGIFIIFQPIVDVLTSICLNLNISFSFGMIIRFVFIVFLMYYLLFINNSKYKKSSLFVLFIIFLYMIIFSFSNMSLFSISSLIKSFYFPILLISLFNIYNESDTLNNKYLLISLFIYVGIILIGDITNTSFQSYDVEKTKHIGHIGWFNSANEIGAIIAILIPILFESIYKKISIVKVLLLLITVIVSFKIGTRIPLLSLFICLVIYYIKYIVYFIKNKHKKTLIATIIISLSALISIIIVFPKTPVYKNIITHSEYLKIDKISDIFKNKETFDNFIFSKRFSLLSDTNKIYKEESIGNKLIGIGYSNKTRTIEMDMFDIFYNFGILGFIIYFGSIIYVFVFNKNKINRIYILPICLIIFISFFAGHVFTAPSVSVLAALIFVKFLLEPTNNKKELLFCSYNLDFGGIEQALINLLKNIDYDKYNVTLVLEKKEGIFLDQINPSVRIIEHKVSNNKNKLVRKAINLLRQIKWIVFNYKTFDFSCCYATYSLSSNLITRLSSNNTMIYIHSNYSQSFGNVNNVKTFFDNREINSFRTIVFVSNESKNDLINIYPSIKEKSVVINNLIDQDKVVNGSKEKIKEIKDKNKTLFTFVGRIDDSSKNIFGLINVFSKLINDNKNIELWIIGDGPDKKEAEKIISEKKLENNIKMLGSRKNPYPYINKSDYIILVSKYEGFPVIYNEAIILNTPIITTIDVTDDYITIPNRFGYIISNDINKIPQEINNILKNKPMKLERVDFNKLNKLKMKRLEKYFDGVI